MKKILLSLFAIALLVVACDKNDMNEGLSPNAIVEQAAEINASVDVDFLALKNQLEGLMGVLPTNKNNGPSTQRGGDNGVNWIELAAFNGTGADASAIFTHVITDGNDIACYGSFSYNGASVVPNTYSFDADGRNATTGILTIEVAGAVQNFDISGALRTTYISSFGSSFDSVFRVATTSNGGFSVSGSQPNRADFTFDSCVNVTDLYNVTAAPFPLTGFLATIIDQSMFTGTSLNYAATTEAAVRTAIEADINDGL